VSSSTARPRCPRCPREQAASSSPANTSMAPARGGWQWDLADVPSRREGAGMPLACIVERQGAEAACSCSKWQGAYAARCPAVAAAAAARLAGMLCLKQAQQGTACTAGPPSAPSRGRGKACRRASSELPNARPSTILQRPRNAGAAPLRAPNRACSGGHPGWPVRCVCKLMCMPCSSMAPLGGQRQSRPFSRLF
jgi:hypothetical protein